MDRCLQCYQVVMHTVGPVFVGNGKEIMKKEYIFLDKRKAVGIPDIRRLYMELAKRKREAAFETYLLGQGNKSLTDWLEQQRIEVDRLRPLMRYTLDCGDAVIERGANRLQIMECIKDPYGDPYIPGSTLKGMFRTILLSADMIAHPDKYSSEKEKMSQEAKNNKNRKQYLKREMEEMEKRAYRILQRPGQKPGDAVNDIMQGFAVSDSEPLSVEDLVLCQKIDRHTDGTEKKLPLLRECIKPGTQVRFTITIDTDICPLNAEQIMKAVRSFMTSYYNRFAKAFAGMDVPKVDQVFCGGGCGFASKTIVYPLYGKGPGIKLAQDVFAHTLPDKVKKQHRHDKDDQYGASPHTIKCTRYQGKTFQMGACRLTKIMPI